MKLRQQGPHAQHQLTRTEVRQAHVPAHSQAQRHFGQTRVLLIRAQQTASYITL